MAINIYYLLIVKIKLQEACTVKDLPLLVVAMPKRQKTMSRTIAIAGLSVPIYEDIEEPKKKIFMVWQNLPENKKIPPIVNVGPFNLLQLS